MSIAIKFYYAMLPLCSIIQILILLHIASGIRQIARKKRNSLRIGIFIFAYLVGNIVGCIIGKLL